MSLNHSPKIVTNGLVLCLDAADKKSYPGTGTTWFDRSGNGNNGTLTNGPTFSSANGGAIVFDGANDFISLNNPTTLRNQNFTISIWINPQVQVTSIISIIDFDHSSVVQGWVLQSEDATTNRNFYFAWYDGSQFQPLLGGSYGVGKGIQITTSVWQNITYSKNGTSLIGYKNGIQVYTGTGINSNVYYASNRNLSVGNALSSNRAFKGDISNTSIYNRALTPQEILQNFNATKGRYGI
jgi:hypothetical protein